MNSCTSPSRDARPSPARRRPGAAPPAPGPCWRPSIPTTRAWPGASRWKGSARHDLEAEQIASRDRGTTAGAGPGPSGQSLKDAGYDYLIEQVRAARESYTAWLHEQAGSLPAALQRTVHAAIGVSDTNLAVLADLLFFDIGLVVGVGEAVVDTIL